VALDLCEPDQTTKRVPVFEQLLIQ
jgi:hypothetical protein